MKTKVKTIWFGTPTLEEMAESRKNTMLDHLGIELIELGPNFLKARMPVDHRTKQPYGIMHGGASCVLAETAASIAANYCVDPDKHYCVGIEINTSHVKSIREGHVTAMAKPEHLGKTTQLWEIPIYNEKGELISLSRLRMAVLTKV